MPVIAMNHELGSRGKEVAEALADELGLKLVRQELFERVADKMQVKKSLVRRVMEGKVGVLDRWTTPKGAISLFSAEEVFEHAAKGNVVIRGWGAGYLLRQVPHCLTVRVCAPFDLRVKRIMQRLETDDEEFVREEVRENDAATAAFLENSFGMTRGDPMIYDLTLNTERVSIESCVEQIKQMLQRPEFKETAASRARIANLALETRIRSELKSDAKTADVNIAIEADNGRVSLTGIVLNEKQKRAAEKRIAGLAGVKAVENNLRLMTGSKRFTSAKW